MTRGLNIKRDSSISPFLMPNAFPARHWAIPLTTFSHLRTVGLLTTNLQSYVVAFLCGACTELFVKICAKQMGELIKL